MSEDPARDDDGDLLAAEYALGLLEGSELAAARRLMLANPAFAEAVERWMLRLAPLADDIAPVEPSDDLWIRIEQILAQGRQSAAVEIAPSASILQQRVNRWRNFALAASAIAATLAVVVVTRQPGNLPSPMQVNLPVLAAGLSSEASDVSLAVVYEPAKGSLLVTPGTLRTDAGRDHELWVIAAGEKPMSLGLVRTGAPQRVELSSRLIAQFRPGSVIAVSIEPSGGSTTGQPTGPVIATGALSSI